MAETPSETISSSNPQFSSSDNTQKPQPETINHSQFSTFSGFPIVQDGTHYQMFPVMCPAFVPGLTHLPNHQQETNRGAGIYAVPVHPFMGHISGFPSNTLIPLTYATPTTRPSSETGAVHDNQEQIAQQQQNQHQQLGPQRPVVVRRFQIAFQIDLLLVLKLAAMIFLFNQDGSRQRLFVLVLFASLVYLYQTGALTPLVRWLSRDIQRAAAPPRPQRAAPRDDNPPAARPGVENAAAAEGQAEARIENHPADDMNDAAGNENAVEPGRAEGGNHLWVIMKEIKMIVFGFISSLLPGFHNID